jgi:hypothetical protein
MDSPKPEDVASDSEGSADSSDDSDDADERNRFGCLPHCYPSCLPDCLPAKNGEEKAETEEETDWRTLQKQKVTGVQQENGMWVVYYRGTKKTFMTVVHYLSNILHPEKDDAEAEQLVPVVRFLINLGAGNFAVESSTLKEQDTAARLNRRALARLAVVSNLFTMREQEGSAEATTPMQHVLEEYLTPDTVMLNEVAGFRIGVRIACSIAAGDYKSLKAALMDAQGEQVGSLVSDMLPVVQEDGTVEVSPLVRLWSLAQRVDIGTDWEELIRVPVNVCRFLCRVAAREVSRMSTIGDFCSYCTKQGIICKPDTLRSLVMTRSGRGLHFIRGAIEIANRLKLPPGITKACLTGALLNIDDKIIAMSKVCTNLGIDDATTRLLVQVTDLKRPEKAIGAMLKIAHNRLDESPDVLQGLVGITQGTVLHFMKLWDKIKTSAVWGSRKSDVSALIEGAVALMSPEDMTSREEHTLKKLLTLCVKAGHFNITRVSNSGKIHLQTDDETVDQFVGCMFDAFKLGAERKHHRKFITSMANLAGNPLMFNNEVALELVLDVEEIIKADGPEALFEKVVFAIKGLEQTTSTKIVGTKLPNFLKVFSECVLGKKDLDAKTLAQLYEVIADISEDTEALAPMILMLVVGKKVFAQNSRECILTLLNKVLGSVGAEYTSSRIDKLEQEADAKAIEELIPVLPTKTAVMTAICQIASESAHFMDWTRKVDAASFILWGSAQSKTIGEVLSEALLSNSSEMATVSRHLGGKTNLAALLELFVALANGQPVSSCLRPLCTLISSHVSSFGTLEEAVLRAISEKSKTDLLREEFVEWLRNQIHLDEPLMRLGLLLAQLTMGVSIENVAGIQEILEGETEATKSLEPALNAALDIVGDLVPELHLPEPTKKLVLAVARLVESQDLATLTEIGLMSGLLKEEQVAKLEKLKTMLGSVPSMTAVNKDKGSSASTSADDSNSADPSFLFHKFASTAESGQKGISFENFVTVTKFMSIEISQEKRMQIFCKCDADGSQVLDIDEFHAAINQLHEDVTDDVMVALGLDESTLLLGFATMMSVILLLLVFIFCGIMAFTTGSSFESVINSLFVAGSGAGVSGADETGSQDEDIVSENINEVVDMWSSE